MNGRSRASSLAASPTMVGAITTLIVIVAVFLAYNANNGLPFVPVYRVSAEMCNASRLAPNNEVRIGGARAGVVESIETIPLDQATGCQTASGSSATAAAKINLKLDQDVEPLPEDSTLRVRYRSSFGLKYLEVTRGTSDSGLQEGGTIPVAQAQEQTEFDDIANTFDTPTRESSRQVLEGFGNAFAGRGESLNLAIQSLNPLFTNLKPVAAALADPTTRLDRFFPELGDAARIVAPVAVDNAEQFTNAGIAFGAIASDEEALRDTIEEGPPTLETGIRSLPVQQPFLRDFAEFSRLLRPGVRDLRASLPVLNQAVGIGAKTLPNTVQMNNDLRSVMSNLELLVDEPSTKNSLIRLGDFFTEANNAGQQIVPVQTVCNYWNYWMTYLTDHFALPDTFGFSEAVVPPSVPGALPPDLPQHTPRNQMGGYSGSQGDGRHTDFNPLGTNPNHGIFDPTFENVNDHPAEDDFVQPILHGNPYGPTGTEQAPNCQAGQTGYVLGQALIPGQNVDNPTFGVRNIAASAGMPPLGLTDLFIRKDGTREFTGENPTP